MKLLEEIIDLAVDNKEPISVLLRKCLVLAATLKNDKLKEWVERELNGYGQDDLMPEYRIVPIVARGQFQGMGGAKIKSVALPSGTLDEIHRSWATTTYLRAPIAAYSHLVEKRDGGVTPHIPWPADLVVRYQQKFIRGYILVAAWQDIPLSAIVSLIDTIRNRVLSFALEIKGVLDSAADNPAAVPTEQVNQHVTNIIYGGNNVIAGAAHHFSQATTVNVQRGDIEGLVSTLQSIGLPDAEIDGLKLAIKEDEESGAAEGVGPKSSSWLARTLAKVGKERMAPRAVQRVAKTGRRPPGAESSESEAIAPPACRPRQRADPEEAGQEQPPCRWLGHRGRGRQEAIGAEIDPSGEGK